jgi:hypothetical protein
MRFSILVAAALLSSVSPAFAQTEGKVSVGASVTFNGTTDDDVDSVIGVGPVVRLNPHRGWGPAGALNWYRADLLNPAGGDDDFARLRVRPLMAGVSYTVGSDTVLTSFSIVAGPSFNSAKFRDYTPAAGETIDAETSVAVRPGIGITWTVAPRVAIIGFGGYMINRPDVLYRDAAGQEFRDRWKADSVVLSIGAVYSLF